MINFKVNVLVLAVLLALSGNAFAECRDAVVLVHGNSGYPADWNNTYDRLLSEGYSKDEIFRPSWGYKLWPTYNNHRGIEEGPVEDALEEALEASCTGKIDVIGHSMGVTLAAKEIIKLDIADQVDTFVGIAGAWKGLWSCGVYPYQVRVPTCGYNGLSINSPELRYMDGEHLADKVYSMKSYVDEIVCGTGVCTVDGKHSSQITGEDDSFTYIYGHFGLQKFTADKQYELIK